MQQTHTSSSTIPDRITEILAKPAEDALVEEVRIGLGYTALLLADGRAGLAYTFRDEARCGCTTVDRSRPLAGRPAGELLSWLPSKDRIEAAVGLACANALVGPPPHEHLAGDILEHLKVRPQDDVAMVGRFGPLIEPIREAARSLKIFERVPQAYDDVLPAAQATEILPRCQVALITATSVINHSVDELLAAAASCREVVITGPSTPLLPQAFHGTAVTLLSGMVVTRPLEVLRVISEGGGTRKLKHYVRKVCLVV